MNNKILSMLGICAKAGKIQSGNFQVENAVKEGKAYLVLLTEDSSSRSKKSYSDMCDFYQTEIYIKGTTDEVSKAIGKTGRKAVAITDEKLAERVRNLLTDELENGGSGRI